MTYQLETAAHPETLRRVAIDPVSRVEGHGKVTILLDDQNKVLMSSKTQAGRDDWNTYIRPQDGLFDDEGRRAYGRILRVSPGRNYYVVLGVSFFNEFVAGQQQFWRVVYGEGVGVAFAVGLLFLAYVLFEVRALEAVLNRFNLGGEQFNIALPKHLKRSLVVSQVAMRMELIIERLKNHIVELRKAQLIQRQFLIPDRSTVYKAGRFEIGQFYEPAKGVSGDLLVIREMSKKHWFIFIGDAYSKGFSSALVMAVVKGYIEALVDTAQRTKQEMDSAWFIHYIANLIDAALKSGKFKLGETFLITAVLGVLDIETGEFTYSNFSHDAPLLYDGKDFREIEDVHSTELGDITQETKDKPEVSTMTLKGGNYLVLYTDGITECRNKKSGLFESIGIINQMTKHMASKSVDVLGKEVMSEALKWNDRKVIEDDMTLIIIKR